MPLHEVASIAAHAALHVGHQAAVDLATKGCADVCSNAALHVAERVGSSSVAHGLLVAGVVAAEVWPKVQDNDPTVASVLAACVDTLQPKR